MILAAGRGERLRPLTDTTPKPLIEIGGETLIERHLRALAGAGFSEVVINVAHLGALIEQRLGDGARYGLSLQYSREPDGALETAGGIAAALPLLGEEAFVVVNADVWTDYDFSRLAAPRATAHLVLVDNPPFHPEGDFSLLEGGIARLARNTHTYSGIGVYTPGVFAGLQAGRARLAPLLFELCRRQALSGEVYGGRWYDIGTRDRLEQVRQAITAHGA